MMKIIVEPHGEHFNKKLKKSARRGIQTHLGTTVLRTALIQLSYRNFKTDFLADFVCVVTYIKNLINFRPPEEVSVCGCMFLQFLQFFENFKTCS